MSIERSRFEVPERLNEESLPERYQQPSWFTEAGQLDRRHEGSHVLKIRDLHREALEYAAEQAKQGFEFDAWLETKGRALSNAKYRLVRNQRESQFLAGEDPELRAECAVLDAEFFRDVRLGFQNWD